MNPNRQPQGIPTGGQFAAAAHSEPDVNLRPGLSVDQNAANYFSDQVQSIRESGLQGSLTATGDRLTYTAPDGAAFDIHQDGHIREDGTPGWVVDNHDQADTDHPAYGLRYETDTDDLDDNVQEAVFDTALGEAFTLNGGSETKDFRQFYSVWPEREPSVVAAFLDVETSDDIEVLFNLEHRDLMVTRNGEVLATEEADAAVKDLVGATSLEVPEGSPSQQMAWHMERSFRMAASRPGNPDWIQKCRVAGLDWDDRHQGRESNAAPGPAADDRPRQISAPERPCTDGPWCAAPRAKHVPGCTMEMM